MYKNTYQSYAKRVVGSLNETLIRNENFRSSLRAFYIFAFDFFLNL